MSTHGYSSGIPLTDVARRAFQRYAERGFQHGHALEDWLAAESELRARVQREAEPEPEVEVAPVIVAAAVVEPEAPKAVPVKRPAKRKRK